VSDYFAKFDAELRAAARRLADPPGYPSRRFKPARPRGLLLVGIALILVAVPAVAAVTGVFDSTRAPQHLAPGSGQSLAPPCKGTSPPTRETIIHGPAPAALTDLVGTLRRPRRPEDTISANHLPHVPYYVDGVRLAYSTHGDAGVRYYLVPTGNIYPTPRVPDTPECAPFRRAFGHRAQPGVCVWRVGGDISGGGCARLGDLRRHGASGPTFGYGYGMKQGMMYVSGVTADGVAAIILRYPNSKPVRTVRIPVRNNVYAAVLPGRPEFAPAVYAQSKDGVKLIQRAPHPTSRRQHELNRRSRLRDLHASGTPTVIPPVGYPHTTFTFRVRVEPRRGYVFVVHVTGPHGLCSEPVKPYAVNPPRTGPTRGLIKLGIGYGPLGLHKMCLGDYEGTVARVRNGAPLSTAMVIKRFRFGVRPRPAGG
jgi:hypothetical protein